MTRLSRRAFAGTSSAALLVLLTACSSSEGETDDSGAAGSSDSGGATGADGAITVEHAFGTTEIPAAPERITTVAWANHERSEEHTSELQSRGQLVCRRLLDKKKN